jgi:hypothetical protein
MSLGGDSRGIGIGTIQVQVHECIIFIIFLFGGGEGGSSQKHYPHHSDRQLVSVGNYFTCMYNVQQAINYSLCLTPMADTHVAQAGSGSHIHPPVSHPHIYSTPPTLLMASVQYHSSLSMAYNTSSASGEHTCRMTQSDTEYEPSLLTHGTYSRITNERWQVRITNGDYLHNCPLRFSEFTQVESFSISCSILFYFIGGAEMSVCSACLKY